MSDKLTLRLREPVQAHKAMGQAWKHIKGWLVSGGGRLVLTVKKETRSLKQNAALHATLSDIAEQLEWAGAKRDTDCWKRLLVSAWLRARGESVEVLPAVDGHGIDVVFRHTSKLTTAECGELLDYVAAWAIEHGVELRDAGQWVDPEAGEITC